MSATAEQSTVALPGVKLISVWAAFGFTSWSDVAAFLAAAYSLLLIGDLVWVRWLRPYAERRGWIAVKKGTP